MAGSGVLDFWSATFLIGDIFPIGDIVCRRMGPVVVGRLPLQQA